MDSALEFNLAVEKAVTEYYDKTGMFSKEINFDYTMDNSGNIEVKVKDIGFEKLIDRV